ncbi:MAG: hypothetical protein ACTSU2_06070 [Promethearchaeota archaeon]
MANSIKDYEIFGRSGIKRRKRTTKFGKKTHRSHILIIIVSLFIISPIILQSLIVLNSNSNLLGPKTGPTYQQYSDSSGFGMPEMAYIPKAREFIQPISNITIISIDSMGPGNTSYEYPNEIYNISFHYLGYKLLNVTKAADSSDWDIDHRNSNITFIVNETARFDYWYNDSVTMLRFRSTLYKGTLKAMYINQTLIDPENITIKEDGGIYYNFSEYYKQNNNGSLIVDYITEYNLTIADYYLYQFKPENYPYLTNNSNTIVGHYNLTFSFGDQNLNLTPTFLINIPDSDYVDNIFMSQFTGGTPGANTYGFPFHNFTLLSNKTVQTSLLINSTKYSVNFDANFTLAFIHRAGSGWWSRDALYSGRSIRERQYELSVIDGPPHILISYFQVNLSSIPYPDFVNVISSFGRYVTATDMNKTIGEREEVIDNITQHIKIYSQMVGTALNFTKRKNSDDTYYLMRGEIDVIKIRYQAERILNIMIVDKENFPLKGVEVKIYYMNVSYGTVMSYKGNEVIPPLITDNYGQVIVPDVPYGNYYIEVIKNGHTLVNSTVTTEYTLNIVSTTIPHFPLWILIYASASTVIMITGWILYRKNKR